jgi:hypothetical protein
MLLIWGGKQPGVSEPRNTLITETLVRFLDGVHKKWWAHQDLNLEPADYESDALTN